MKALQNVSWWTVQKARVVVDCSCMPLDPSRWFSELTQIFFI